MREYAEINIVYLCIYPVAGSTQWNRLRITLLGISKYQSVQQKQHRILMYVKSLH